LLTYIERERRRRISKLAKEKMNQLLGEAENEKAPGLSHNLIKDKGEESDSYDEDGEDDNEEMHDE
jgi:hypothetical protein